jgi:hypothetical protein
MFILRASEVVRVKADLLSCSMAMPAVDRERQEKDALSVGRSFTSWHNDERSIDLRNGALSLCVQVDLYADLKCFCWRRRSGKEGGR